MTKSRTHWLSRAGLAVAVATTLAACGGGGGATNGTNGPGPTDPTSGNNAGPNTPAAFRAQFQPTAGVLPYPTDLYFNDGLNQPRNSASAATDGSADGTLNIQRFSFNPGAAAVNGLDGFSTTGDITVRFSSAIDAASLATPGAITVVELCTATVVTSAGVAKVPAPGAPGCAPGSPVRRVLAAGVDYSVGLDSSVDAAGSTLRIRPLKPLVPSPAAVTPTLPVTAPAAGAAPVTVDARGVSYLVIVTNAVRSTANTAAAADVEYARVKAAALAGTCGTLTSTTLQGVCSLVGPQLQLAGGILGAPALPNVILTFSFSTQSTDVTLTALRTAIEGGAAPAIAAFPVPNGVGGTLNTRNVNAALAGKSDLYLGRVTIPYYSSAPSVSAPTAPLTTPWFSATPVTLVAGQPATRFITRFNRTPVKTTDLTVPLLVLRPNATSVSTGAKPPAGYPVVIFQHGITRNRADALAVADAFADAGFVVVAMDLALHGITPTSPTAFLRVPGTTEQTFDVDYVNNTTLAPGADGQVDGSGSSFVNLSNTLVTRDNLRQSVVGLMALTRALPGLDLDGDTVGDIDPTRISFVGHSLGGIVGTVFTANSTALRSSSILMAGGGVAQTIVDSPAFGPVIIAGLQRQSALFQPGTTFFNTFIRDAQTAADAGDPLNYVAAALAAKPMHFTQVVGGSGAGQVADQVVPNSSTARLFAAAGAGLTRTTAAGFAAPDTFVNFTAGDHGTILDPTRSLAATIEMQRQVVTFAAFGGAQYLVQDTSVIQP